MESSIGTSLPPIVLRGDWIPDYIPEELGVEKNKLAVVVNRKDAFADILRKKNLE